ncbi:MAG: TolC family protein [Alistipes sp.]|nr:TolC family protein [Candidatus Alistipes equi]
MKKILFLLSVLCPSLVFSQQVITLGVEKCTQMALCSSEEMQIAQIECRQAELQRRIAQAAFTPKIEGSAMGVYMPTNLDMTSMQVIMKGMYMAGVTLTQPIFVGGKIVAGHALSKIGEKAANDKKRLKKSEIIASSEQAYWTLLAVERKVRMMERYTRQLETLYSQTESAVTVGLATENDLGRVRAHRDNIRYQTLRAKNGYELSRMALCYQIGVDFDTRIILADSLITIPTKENFVGDASRRAELSLLEAQVHAGKYQQRMARADLLPSLALSLGYNYFGNVKMQTITMLPDGTPFPYTSKMQQGLCIGMLALKVPIFHWGEGWKKLKSVKYDTRRAELELQKTRRLLTLEVQQAQNNLEESLLLCLSAQTAMEAAEENLRVSTERYGVNMSTLTELLDAQSEWQKAESSLIEAQSQYKIYKVAYLKATGQF